MISSLIDVFTKKVGEYLRIFVIIVRLCDYKKKIKVILPEKLFFFPNFSNLWTTGGLQPPASPRTSMTTTITHQYLTTIPSLLTLSSKWFQAIPANSVILVVADVDRRNKYVLISVVVVSTVKIQIFPCQKLSRTMKKIKTLRKMLNIIVYLTFL